MVRNVSSRIVISCCAAALATACGDRTRDTQARGHEGAPIHLTGCLQKGDGMMSSYVLTQVNSPASVGTSGSVSDSAAAKSDASAVKNEQLREAKHAYELSGDKDQFEKLVGKQVSVEGIIADTSNLREKAADAKKSNKAPDIDTGDLTKVDVKSIVQVSDACGDRAPRQ